MLRLTSFLQKSQIVRGPNSILPWLAPQEKKTSAVSSFIFFINMFYWKQYTLLLPTFCWLKLIMWPKATHNFKGQENVFLPCVINKENRNFCESMSDHTFWFILFAVFDYWKKKKAGSLRLLWWWWTHQYIFIYLDNFFNTILSYVLR